MHYRSKCNRLAEQQRQNDDSLKQLIRGKTGLERQLRGSRIELDKERKEREGLERVVKELKRIIGLQAQQN